MGKILTLLLGGLIIISQLYAQNRTITGTIVDKAGSPVPNASIMVRGTNVGTTSKMDGTFSLTVPSSAKILMVSAIGLAEQQVTIGTNSTLEVSLKDSDRGLEEVVVVGYQQRRKRDEAGAISTIRAKEIENLPNPTLDKALQGRAAGVLVQANNGIPGGAINVRIRGTGSFNAGTQPLYVVDGVQLNIRNDAGFTQSNPLSFLNPNDIESIDILKDAASAAIYGAQASNGVIIITTKKGKAGKTRFTFTAYAGQAMPLKTFDVGDAQDYAQLRYEALQNANPTLAPLTIKRSVLTELRVPTGAITSDKAADSAFATLPTYDWQDAVFRNGTVQNYEISASGGNERSTFRVSAGYTKQEAIVTKADFTRGNVKFDITNKATDRLNIGGTINLSTTEQKLPFAVEGSFLGSPAFASALIIPSNPIYTPEGGYFGLSPANLAGVLNQNIVAVNELNKGYQRTNQAVGNVNFDYKLTNWLTFRSLFGIDYRIVQGKLYRDPRTPDAFVRRGLGQVQSNWNTNILTTQTLNFQKQFGEVHRLDGVVGFEYRKETNESISASGDGFPTPDFTTLNTAANPVTVGEFYSGFRRNGVFGSVNYNYDGRYLISGTLRYDGSSRFGEDNQFGLFPSVKVAWNLDNEQFISQATWITALRLRASWGSTGNDQIGNFDALGLYGGGLVYSGSPGITYNQLANPELKWEVNQTTNIGVDFGFLNNRINGSVELYNKITKDLLLSQPLQLTTGFASFTENVGEIQNKGVELTLSLVPIRSSRQEDGFEWTSTFIFAYNKNSVKSLYGGLKELPGDPSTQIGKPLGTIFTQQYAGVNPATGRPMWYDSTGNLTYQVQARDRVVIGDNQPEFTGGLTNVFRYKGFTLDVFFQYEYGRIVSDGQINFTIENVARFNTIQDQIQKRWTAPGQVTSFPRMNTSAESNSSGALSGSRPFFKADYIRLKNITLSYDIQRNVMNKIGMNSLRFFVQGTNLYTYSDWYGYDVEFVGAGTGIIPNSKNVTVGVQAGF